MADEVVASQSWDSVSVSGHTTGGQERRKEAQMTETQRRYFEAARRIIWAGVGSGWHWENRNGRRVWVPGK